MARERPQRVFRDEHAPGHEYEVHFAHRIAYQQCQDRRGALQPVNSSSRTTKSTILAMTESISRQAISPSPRITSMTTWISATAIMKTPCRARSASCRRAPTVNRFQNILIDSNLSSGKRTRAFVSNVSAGHQRLRLRLDECHSDQQCRDHERLLRHRLLSIHNGLIANNTVVADGRIATPGCTAAVSVGDKTHTGAWSNNTVVRNNLASRINVERALQH